MNTSGRRAFRVGLTGIALAVVTLGLPIQAANAGESKASSADSSTAASAGAGATASSGSSRSSGKDASAYWTSERMAKATSVPLPKLSAEQSARVQDDAAKAATEQLAPQSAPPTAPKTRSASSAPGGDLSAMSLNKAERWGKAGSAPALTTGRLFFVNNNGADMQCTASVITADNHNTLWTAGHCVHPGGDGADAYYDVNRMAFAPDDDGGAAPHGLWEATYTNTTKGWQDDEDFQSDLAAVEVTPQTANGNLQDFTGAQGYRFGHGQDFSDVTFLGYPAAGNGRSFPGDELYYCQGDTEDASVWFWDERLQMVCDMGQGSSGGPWLDDMNSGGGGYIVGAMSHIDDNDPNVPDDQWDDDHGWSSNHGDGAINVYNDVSKH
ncbi:trypsin-like serine peptidase [Streptomyces sp. NPDC048441]|uniref:trypsin-like serine peptidase n=1 Tax=Streptomyces sp. NPDC048441 TaxID=3365552 RepID=UPI0037115931